MKSDFVCDIEKLVLLLSFEPSEIFPVYTLGYHRKENYNNLICLWFIAVNAQSYIYCFNLQALCIWTIFTSLILWSAFLFRKLLQPLVTINVHTKDLCWSFLALWITVIALMVSSTHMMNDYFGCAVDYIL